MRKEKSLMSMCQVYGCGMNIDVSLVSLDNGKKKVVLCRNHLALFGSNPFNQPEIYIEPSERTDHQHCECCDKEDTIKYKDFEVTFYLCERHMRDFIDHRLSPKAFKKLYQKAGDVYMLHNDFYDPETGEAFQPIIRN